MRKAGALLMSRTGEKLLSKIIQNNDPQAIVRYNLRSNHFRTQEERDVLRFIKDYAEKNQNQAPPFDTVVEEILEFNYEPNVGDTYDYLVNDLKGTNAKYGFFTLQ